MSTKSTSKKPTRRRKTNPIYWVRTTTGDEFISEAVVTKTQVKLINPTTIAYASSLPVLAPYCCFTETNEITLQMVHVLHVTEPTTQVKELYELSIKKVDFVKRYYNSLVEQSIGLFSIEKGPTNKELDAIEAEDTRPKSDVLDNLIRLADLKGKGKGFSGKDS